MIVVYDVQGRRIRLGDEVGRGAEATVYHVPKETGLLAKVFDLDAPSRIEAKVAWMVAHPPENPADAQGHVSTAWPLKLLYDRQRRFIGYLVPYVRNAVPLLQVFNPRLRARTFPRFDRRYLHRTARNLAAAVGAVHARGYVIGDVHESNVMVTPSALVTLVDADSFQVRTEDGSLYRCPMGKPEYTPPELQGRPFARVARTVEHDRFGLGVLIFQLLMEGSHPFRARWLGSGDPLPLEERIRRGCFPYWGTPPCPVAPPGNAPTLDVLHPLVSELVCCCFAEGHSEPDRRPTPMDWEAALVEAEQRLVACPRGHYHADHLVSCPLCRNRSGRQRGWSQAPSQALQRVLAPRPVAAASTPPSRTVRRRVSATQLILGGLQRWPNLAWIVPVLCALGLLLACFVGLSQTSPRSMLSSPQPTKPAIQAILVKSSVADHNASLVGPISVQTAAQVSAWGEPFRAQGIDHVVWASNRELLTRIASSSETNRIAYTLATTPDHGTLAFVWTDNRAWVWQAADAQPLGTLQGYDGQVNVVSLSPRSVTGDTWSMLVALGSAAGVVDVWRWEDSGQARVGRLSGHSKAVTSIAFSHDGSLLATGSTDRTVCLWRVSRCVLLLDHAEECATQVRILREHSEFVSAIAFSPDSLLLAVGTGGGTVQLWRVSDGMVLRTLTHARAVRDIAFTPDGTVLAVGLSDGSIWLWSASGDVLVADLNAGSVGMQSLAFSPDGWLLAAKTTDGQLVVWGLGKNQQTSDADLSFDVGQ